MTSCLLLCVLGCLVLVQGLANSTSPKAKRLPPKVNSTAINKDLVERLQKLRKSLTQLDTKVKAVRLDGMALQDLLEPGTGGLEEDSLAEQKARVLEREKKKDGELGRKIAAGYEKKKIVKKRERRSVEISALRFKRGSAGAVGTGKDRSSAASAAVDGEQRADAPLGQGVEPLAPMAPAPIDTKPAEPNAPSAAGAGAASRKRRDVPASGQSAGVAVAGEDQVGDAAVSSAVAAKGGSTVTGAISTGGTASGSATMDKEHGGSSAAGTAIGGGGTSVINAASGTGSSSGAASEHRVSGAAAGASDQDAAITGSATGAAVVQGTANNKAGRGKASSSGVSVAGNKAGGGGSASGKGAATTSAVSGATGAGVSSGAAGKSHASGSAAEGQKKGVGSATGALSTGGKAKSGAAASGSALGGSAATSLSGSDDDDDDDDAGNVASITSLSARSLPVRRSLFNGAILRRSHLSHPKVFNPNGESNDLRRRREIERGRVRSRGLKEMLRTKHRGRREVGKPTEGWKGSSQREGIKNKLRQKKTNRLEVDEKKRPKREVKPEEGWKGGSTKNHKLKLLLTTLKTPSKMENKEKKRGKREVKPEAGWKAGGVKQKKDNRMGKKQQGKKYA